MTQRVKVAGFLIFLFILSLQTSMSAMDFFASLLFIFVGSEIFKRSKEFKHSQVKYVLRLISPWVWGFTLAFFLSVVIGFIFFADAKAPALKVLFEFKWFLFLLSLTAFFTYFNVKNEIKFAFLFTYALVVLYVLICYLFEVDFFGDVDRLDETTIRAGGFFSNPMTFAHSFQFFVFMMFASVLVTFSAKKLSIFKQIKNLEFVTLTALFVAGGTCLYLSMTRGVWLGALAGLLSGLILHLKTKAIKPILGLFFLIVVLFLTSNSLQNRVIQTLNPQASYDSERLVLWSTNWKIFLESPLFGIGYGENKRLLRQYYDKYGVPEGQFEGHAHNQYLHFLAGTGLFGFISYISLFFYFIVLSVKIYLESKNDDFVKIVSLGSFMGLICFFIAGMTESNFQHAKLKYALVYIWSITMYFFNSQKKMSVKIDEHS